MRRALLLVGLAASLSAACFDFEVFERRRQEAGDLDGGTPGGDGGCGANDLAGNLLTPEDSIFATGTRGGWTSDYPLSVSPVECGAAVLKLCGAGANNDWDAWLLDGFKAAANTTYDVRARVKLANPGTYQANLIISLSDAGMSEINRSQGTMMNAGWQTLSVRHIAGPEPPFHTDLFIEVRDPTGAQKAPNEACVEMTNVFVGLAR